MNIKINKIQLNNFRFFIDDKSNNTFEPNGKSMLVYGENGSGKSSLFKAFDYLSKISNQNISDEFKKDKNIFNLQKDSSINFEFNNDDTLEITDDSDINNDLIFINNLSVFMPMLEYKNILDVSYEVKKINDSKNLYDFFEQLLEDYPIGDNKVLKNLSEAKDEKYFDVFKNILDKELFENINLFLKEFNQGFKIEKINFSAGYKSINLDIDYFGEIKSNYHNFLNEARLSALAISIYLSIIKKQFNLLKDDSLKILVLDDLLISLDMGNRLNLVNILKNEFSDYQIFFFTHDKGLFEIFKDKMDWKSYEIYVNDTKHEYETPLIVKKETYLTRAMYEFKNERYDCSANLLRKYSEKLFFDYLPKKERYSDTCDKLQLNDLFQKTLSLTKDKKEINETISELKGFNKTIFNPQSHHDDSNLYKKELKNAIECLKRLQIIISNSQ
jgi:ABC-type lipoprotein export system ATPase subunit